MVVCSGKDGALQASGKLLALQSLLLECGLSPSSSNNPSSIIDSTNDVVVASPHRLLIFAQLKQSLDVIEKILFQEHMPWITYRRLDGDTPPADRVQIAREFNKDPSIDVLLLTTHVGGLGLNLTGAGLSSTRN